MYSERSFFYCHSTIGKSDDFGESILKNIDKNFAEKSVAIRQPTA